MFESKYSKLLTVLLIIGIIIIVGALLFLGIYVIRNNQKIQDYEDAAEQFQNRVSDVTQNTEENNIATNEIAPELGVENIVVEAGQQSPSSSNSNTQTFHGFPVAGTIEIPAINLKSVILENASAEAIEEAVGIYDGAGLNQVGNTTIAGHNYRDGRFFANNKQLVEGDRIYITDNTGKKVTYSIYKTYITSPEDSTHLERDTQGKREITLVTCTDDTQSRLIILASEQ